jgi:alpha-ketoglutarate-dependent taurine dioxygenase
MTQLNATRLPEGTGIRARSHLQYHAGIAAHGITYLSPPKGLGEEAAVVATATAAVKPHVEDAADVDPLDPQSLELYRRRLAEVAPELCEFAQAVKIRLLCGAMAVEIDQIGLKELPLQTKRHVLYALANLIGEPTATDPRKRRVLWDVKPRPVSPGHFATFSEHDGEAQFHTDTQYYPDPERFFFLYAVQAARCGGGKSYFADATDVIGRMTRTASGRRAFATLSTVQVPFRIPSAFAFGNEAQYTWASIIRAVPLIRYREDTLLDCEHCFPDVPWLEIKTALTYFNEATAYVSTSRAVLPDDSIIFVNNHQALHARTEFKDQDRHLIRVRMNA